MSRAPQARPESRPKAGRSYYRRLPRWSWRRHPLTCKVKLRGGAECWLEIHSRGGLVRVPGSVSIYEVFALIANE